MNDLNQVIDLIKSGDKAAARQLLLELLHQDRENDQAWLYLAACATTKREFEVSIQQALKLNPLNSQALQLAQKHGIALPEAAKQAKRRKKSAKSGGGRRGFRILLLLLVILAALAGAVVAFMQQGDDQETAVEVVETATLEPTEEVTLEPTLEPTTEPTLEPTTEPTEEPTSTPTATITPSPEVTEEPTTEPSPTQTEAPLAPVTTEEVALVATEVATIELPISPDPTSYFAQAYLASGSPDALTTASTYAADVPLFLVIDLKDHGETLAIVATMQADVGGAPLSVETEAEAQSAHTVLLPLKTEDTLLEAGRWVVNLSLNEVVIIQLPTFITPAESLPTPAGEALPTSAPVTPTPEASPTPELTLPDVPPTLRLVYTIETLYIQNISEDNLDISALRFVQQLGTQEISYEALEWQQGTYRGPGSVYALQPERCFQVGLDRGSASAKAPECLFLDSWQVRDLDGQFWLLNNGNVRSFLVYQGDTPIAECDIDAGVCEFGLVPVEE